jgi:hypothetical protein
MNFPKNMNEVGQQPWFQGGLGIWQRSDGTVYGRQGEKKKGHFTVVFIDPSFLPANWESLISENVEGINWDNGQAAAVGTTFRQALKDLKTRFWPLLQTNH